MNIFQKVRLHPTQLRTVADRRFADADVLRKTGKNTRANGSMYLGGFVIECLLKAMLLERYPWLQTAGSPQVRGKDDQYLWSLCYRSHDLDEYWPDFRISKRGCWRWSNDNHPVYSRLCGGFVPNGPSSPGIPRIMPI